MTKTFSEDNSLVPVASFWTATSKLTSEDIVDITVWDNKIWIAGETKIWHTDYTTFNPTTSIFTEVDVATYTVNTSGESNLSHINTILPVVGNYRASSSLNSNVINLLKNPSYFPYNPFRFLSYFITTLAGVVLVLWLSRWTHINEFGLFQSVHAPAIITTLWRRS